MDFWHCCGQDGTRRRRPGSREIELVTISSRQPIFAQHSEMQAKPLSLVAKVNWTAVPLREDRQQPIDRTLCRQLEGRPILPCA